MTSAEDAVRDYFATLNNSELDGVARLFADDGALIRDEDKTITAGSRSGTLFMPYSRKLPSSVSCTSTVCSTSETW